MNEVPPAETTRERVREAIWREHDEARRADLRSTRAKLEEAEKRTGELREQVERLQRGLLRAAAETTPSCAVRVIGFGFGGNDEHPSPRLTTRDETKTTTEQEIDPERDEGPARSRAGTFRRPSGEEGEEEETMTSATATPPPFRAQDSAPSSASATATPPTMRVPDTTPSGVLQAEVRAEAEAETARLDALIARAEAVTQRLESLERRMETALDRAASQSLPAAPRVTTRHSGRPAIARRSAVQRSSDSRTGPRRGGGEKAAALAKLVAANLQFRKELGGPS